MKLDDIGFYTLSDERAKNVSWNSRLQRCEMILTDRCNFKCQYCRGIKEDLRGDLTFSQAKEIVDIWSSGELKNIRLSGGEPTVWIDLYELIIYIKSKGNINRIALSTNGSADLDYYFRLHNAGVDDFSISLDACCSMTADAMAGTDAKFEHISHVIKELSKITYVTVGVVLNNRNNIELNNIIDYATNLGVSDIRIIPSAQTNERLKINRETEYKILKYRISNINNGRHVRGITKNDCHKCHLVKDDMAILHGRHFPCIIYMREFGQAIGTVYGKSLTQIRQERKKWFEKTNTYNDDICRRNCLDVCIDYNNRVEQINNTPTQREKE